MTKITTLMAILLFTAMTTVAVQAATLRCTIETVEDGIVTMDCGEKAATLSPGTEVKVKVARAKAAAAIEGC